jgi:hypothetical protein
VGFLSRSRNLCGFFSFGNSGLEVLRQLTCLGKKAGEPFRLRRVGSGLALGLAGRFSNVSPSRHVCRLGLPRRPNGLLGSRYSLLKVCGQLISFGDQPRQPGGLGLAVFRGLTGFRCAARICLGLTGFCCAAGCCFGCLGLTGFCCAARICLGLTGFCCAARICLGLTGFCCAARICLGFAGFCCAAAFFFGFAGFFSAAAFFFGSAGFFSA